MRKVTTLILVFAFIGIASSQVSVKNKSNGIVQNDTLKKDNLTAESAETIKDSSFVIKGALKPFKKDVHASYYHDKFSGKRTASGKIFSNKKYTAAHRKFPFGTMLKITNEANGKFVVVEVNDRGPFAKGREIDLSKRAFMEIASNKNSGGIKVKIEIIEP